MKEQLIKLLGLDAKATDEQIIEAVTKLKQQAAALAQASSREQAIVAKMQKTGMQRSDAEHVIDQQAKEDEARKKAAKKK